MEVGERLEYYVSAGKFGSGAISVLDYCYEATANLLLSRGLVFCAELHHGVGEELDFFHFPPSQQQLHSERFVASHNSGHSQLMCGHLLIS